MADPALGHPASRARLSLSRPSAPPPIPLAIGVNACLLIFAGLIVVTDAPSWSFLLPLVAAAAVFTVSGRRAAKALGIRSRDETPRGWIMAMALPSGLVGVLAFHTGQYAGFVLTAYLVLVQAGERIAWRRFRASTRPAAHA